MFGYCSIYGWRGHYWNKPLYNDSLETVDQIFKCRCGETKTRIVKQPLPDTVEFKQKHERDYIDPLEDSYNNEHDDVDVSDDVLSASDLIKALISFVVALIVFLVVVPPVMRDLFCSSVLNGTC